MKSVISQVPAENRMTENVIKELSAKVWGEEPSQHSAAPWHWQPWGAIPHQVWKSEGRKALLEPRGKQWMGKGHLTGGWRNRHSHLTLFLPSDLLLQPSTGQNQRDQKAKKLMSSTRVNVPGHRAEWIRMGNGFVQENDRYAVLGKKGKPSSHTSCSYLHFAICSCVLFVL